jgi:histone H3/H4
MPPESENTPETVLSPVQEEQDETETTNVQTKRSKRKQSHPKRRSQYVIPSTSMRRMIKHITVDCKPGSKFLWSTAAVQALHQALEEEVESRFVLCKELSELCNRQTVTKEILDFTNKIMKS